MPIPHRPSEEQEFISMEAMLTMVVAIVSNTTFPNLSQGYLITLAWYSAGSTGPIPWTIYNAENVLVENIKMTQSLF
jgi:hypothetical protein